MRLGLGEKMLEEHDTGEVAECSAAAAGPVDAAHDGSETGTTSKLLAPAGHYRDGSLGAIMSTLRLALKASEADVACIVGRERIKVWVSRRRSSCNQADDATAIFADNGQEPGTGNTKILSRWLARSHTLRLPVDKSRGLYLVASRRRSRGSFSTADVAMLQDSGRVIMGLIDRVVARYLNRALSAATDGARMGIIIADESGTVMFTNAAAHRFMKRHGSFRIADNRLVGRSAEESAAIRESLAAVRSASALAIEGEDGTPCPVAAARLDLAGRSAIALYVADPDQPAPPPEWLQLVYNMTRREAEVSALLAEGQNVSEVACALGLSEATVKSYCKDVFAKLDVRRKPDLVRTLSCGPLALVAPHPAGGKMPANDSRHSLASAS